MPSKIKNCFKACFGCLFSCCIRPVDIGRKSIVQQHIKENNTNANIEMFQYNNDKIIDNYPNENSKNSLKNESYALEMSREKRSSIFDDKFKSEQPSTSMTNLILQSLGSGSFLAMFGGK